MAQIKAKVEYGKLENAVKAMSQQYSVKVGLLATKGGAEPVGENLDFAGLGAVHEFGATIQVTDKMRAFLHSKLGIHLKASTKVIVIPARSFLTLPLTTQKKRLAKHMVEHFGGEGVESIEYWIATKGDLQTVAIMMGASAVETIQEAFESSGWGEWAPDSAITIEQKGSALPLVNTGSLRERITYDVEQRM